MRRLALVAMVIGGVALLAAPPASAHTRLKEASPAIGSTGPSPARLVLTYADPVIVPQLVVTDAAGGRHESGKAEAIDNKVTQPVAGTLRPGTYSVAWRVVASDGHPVTGTYKFTVEGAAPGSAPAASTAPVAPVAAEKDSSGGAGWLWIGLVALLAAGVAGGVALLRRCSV